MKADKNENLKVIKRFDANRQVFVQEGGLLGRENLLETVNDLIDVVNYLVENRDKYVTKSSLRKLLAKITAIKAKTRSTSPKGPVSDER